MRTRSAHWRETRIIAHSLITSSFVKTCSRPQCGKRFCADCTDADVEQALATHLGAPTSERCEACDNYYCAACQDEAVKHMAFWLVSLQRTWGAFQKVLGAALWVIIFNLPVKYRAPVHFLVGYLQIVVGFIAASLAWGCCLPDLVQKYLLDNVPYVLAWFAAMANFGLSIHHFAPWRSVDATEEMLKRRRATVAPAPED